MRLATFPNFIDLLCSTKLALGKESRQFTYCNGLTFVYVPKLNKLWFFQRVAKVEKFPAVMRWRSVSVVFWRSGNTRNSSGWTSTSTPWDKSDSKNVDKCQLHVNFDLLHLSEKLFQTCLRAEDNVKEWGLLVIECIHMIDSKLVQNRRNGVCDQPQLCANGTSINEGRILITAFLDTRDLRILFIHCQSCFQEEGIGTVAGVDVELVHTLHRESPFDN